MWVNITDRKNPKLFDVLNNADDLPVSTVLYYGGSNRRFTKERWLIKSATHAWDIYKPTDEDKLIVHLLTY